MNDDGTEQKRPPSGVVTLTRFLSIKVVQGAWGIHPGDNILLLVPEKRLPRLRVVSILLRVIVLFAIIVKTIAILQPALHLLLLLGDMVFATVGFSLAALLAGWAHARDLRERFRLDHLLLVPDGPRAVTQVLFMRPLGLVAGLLFHYYFFSMTALVLNLFLAVALEWPNMLTLGTITGLCFVVLAFQGPWILLMSGLMISATANAARAVMLPDRNPMLACGDTLLRAMLAVAVLLGAFLLSIPILFGLFEYDAPVAFFIVIVLVCVFSLGSSRALAHDAVHPWIMNAMTRLHRDLENAWNAR